MKNESAINTNISYFPSLQWEHQLKKRYYKIVLPRDLLGDWVLTRVLGELGKQQAKLLTFIVLLMKMGYVWLTRSLKLE